MLLLHLSVLLVFLKILLAQKFSNDEGEVSMNGNEKSDCDRLIIINEMMNNDVESDEYSRRGKIHVSNREELEWGIGWSETVHS